MSSRCEWKIIVKFMTLHGRVIKSRRLRWAGNVARMGERRGAYRVLVGIPVRRRPFARPRLRWEDNIKMDLREVRGEYGLDRCGSG
jgi:hypothetical protein